jgi:hypothetical protein
MNKRAVDLVEGDVIDVPEAWVAGTDNEVCAQYEYATVECVNGGWLDNAAGPDEVVIYVPNFAAPIVAKADALVEVVGTVDCSLCDTRAKEAE